MSRLSVDDIMALFAAHDVITTRTAGGPHGDPAAQWFRWNCRCGDGGERVIDMTEVAAGRGVPFPALGRRHLAEVIAAAVELSQREPAQSFSADEAAADYYRQAAQIMNRIGGHWPRLNYVWRIESSIVSCLLRAGNLRVVRSGVYELHGIRVMSVQDPGSLDDDAPTFELVVSP